MLKSNENFNNYCLNSNVCSSICCNTMVGRLDMKINISEIFGPVIQGEGALIGLPTIFVRTQGCDQQCTWCDTKYAWSHTAGTPMTADEIIAEIKQHSEVCRLVTISGGNPCLWDLSELVVKLKEQGYMIAVETQGTIFKSWLASCDFVSVSPKPPSAGVEVYLDSLEQFKLLDNLPFNNVLVYFKIVVFNDEDFEFAKTIVAKFPDMHTYLQVGTPQSQNPQILQRLKWLAEKTLNDPDMLLCGVLPQLHVLMYGQERGR